MIRSILMGAVAGARSMTPLAAVSVAAWLDELPEDNGAPEFLAHPAVVAGTVALAAGELAGDKLPSAPDRIVLPGMLARIASGAIAGAAMAPRDKRVLGGALGAGAAIAASYVTFNLRMKALRRMGQVPSGLAEDAMVIGATALLAGSARKD